MATAGSVGGETALFPLMKTTFDVQHVYNRLDGGVEVVEGKMEWDEKDKDSKLHWIMEDGSKVEMEPGRLEEVNDEGRVYYVYKDPGFRLPTKPGK
jgi:hypothetical protein